MRYLFMILVFGCMLMWSSCSDCDEIIPEACGGAANIPQVDLIILIDASTSMGTVATKISDAAKSSIDSSGTLCMTDIRVKYFGLDGIWPGTVFNESHRNYLYSLHGSSVALAADIPPMTYLHEQGANGIDDLSNLFDWRNEACRAILYISDEELDGCCPLRVNFPTPFDSAELAREQGEVDLAIASAQLNMVSVFSHLIDQNSLHVGIQDQYQQLSTETNGIHEISIPSSITNDFYVDFLKTVICNSCNSCSLNDFVN